MSNPYIDTKNLILSSECSLFRAISYIAFGDLPYEEDVCKILHEKTNEAFEYHIELDYLFETREAQYECTRYEQFHLASNAFSLKLKSVDEPILSGMPLHNLKCEPFNNERILYRFDSFIDDYKVIPSEFWKCEHLMIDFLNNEADGEYTDAYIPEIYPAYTNIRVNTRKLYELFPEQYSKTNSSMENTVSKPSARGRPKGSNTYSDDAELGFMHALIIRENLSVAKAAEEALTGLHTKGASKEAIIDRLRSKYSQKFRSGD